MPRHSESKPNRSGNVSASRSSDLSRGRKTNGWSETGRNGHSVASLRFLIGDFRLMSVQSSRPTFVAMVEPAKNWQRHYVS